MKEFNLAGNLDINGQNNGVIASIHPTSISSSLEKIADVYHHYTGSGGTIPVLIEDLRTTIVTEVNDWTGCFSCDMFEDFSYLDSKNIGNTDILTTARTLIDEITGEYANAASMGTNTMTRNNRIEPAVSDHLLSEAISIATDSLIDFQNSFGFSGNMATAFGNNTAHSAAMEAVSDLISGNADISYQITNFENSLTHAAFAADSNTIYLSESFLNENQANFNIVSDVILEEWGHHLNAVLNEVDTVGDEGEIFMSLVKGLDFNFDLLTTENDHATMNINGNAVMVEQSAFGSADLTVNWTVFRSDRGSILAFKRDETLSTATDIYFYNAGTGRQQFFDKQPAGTTIFNGQFVLTTPTINNTTTQIDFDGNIVQRSGFIRPRLTVNAPRWTHIAI